MRIAFPNYREMAEVAKTVGVQENDNWPKEGEIKVIESQETGRKLFVFRQMCDSKKLMVSHRAPLYRPDLKEVANGYR